MSLVVVEKCSGLEHNVRAARIEAGKEFVSKYYPGAYAL